MKNIKNLLQLKRLYQLKNMGYNYTDMINIDTDQPESPTLSSNMDELRKTVLQCHFCQLSKTRNNVVFGEGSEDAKVVFVGEGPGATEDATGRPFVGRAGALLTKMIENVLEIKRREVFIANVVKCRPPNNRVPTFDEVMKCKPYLDKQLEIIAPRLVVALGATAFTHLTGEKSSISKVRGELFEMKNYKLIPTFHPSYLLRNPSAKKEAYADLLKIKSFL